MNYKNICLGTFVARPNRFLSIVDLEGSPVKAHVKNTGRCGELLVPGVRVALQDFRGHLGKRKTSFDLIAVEKRRNFGTSPVNIDSQLPNALVKEALLDHSLSLPGLGPLDLVKPETTYASSRFDFYLEDTKGQKAYLEVKGVTLEEEDHVFFPDAPTLRGKKHVKELIQAKKDGYLSYLLFLVQMDHVKAFHPNWRTDPAFAGALVEAREMGVCLLSYSCQVDWDRVLIQQELPLSLNEHAPFVRKIKG